MPPLSVFFSPYTPPPYLLSNDSIAYRCCVVSYPPACRNTRRHLLTSSCPTLREYMPAGIEIIFNVSFRRSILLLSLCWCTKQTHWRNTCSLILPRRTYSPKTRAMYLPTNDDHLYRYLSCSVCSILNFY